KISIYYSLNRQTATNGNVIATFALPAPINGAQDQRTHTARINYDNTLRPTLLLHVGIGLMHTVVIQTPQPYDATQIRLNGQYTKYFPYISGLSTGALGAQGGYCGSGCTGSNIGPGTITYLTNDKPTANASLTWIHGNHIYKAGGELVINGFPGVNQHLF